MNKATVHYGYKITMEKPLKSGHAYWDTITCWGEAEKDDCLNLADIYDWKIISIKPFTWIEITPAVKWTREA